MLRIDRRNARIRTCPKIALAAVLGGEDAALSIIARGKPGWCGGGIIPLAG